MTDWHAVKANDYAVPETVDNHALVEELAAMLASPDPVQRDELAYSILATWIDRGVLDDDACHRLGDEMARRMTAGDVWVRSFAPLILDCLVSHGPFDPAWVAAFERWYAAESDLRGHDPELGWLHAVAHGADLLAALGQHCEVDPVTMLDLAASRLVTPTQTVWRDGEDERLGYAIGLTLTRSELSGTDSIGWIQAVEDSWTAREPGPPPAWVSNASRTLRMVLGLTLTGVRPSGTPEPLPLAHAEAVRDRLLSALRTLTPYMW